MDDFALANLHESRNEWCGRLVSIFTPLINEGIRSIFNESWKMCCENDEKEKYLMTFQNLLTRIPKWNSVIIETERKRIIERSGCNYLEDLISCVHIIQLKVLTCIRVGNKQKQIDISIPKLDTFIHKIYIHAARKVYANVYLFENNISPLTQQKNNREFEQIIQECILTTIRDSIPTEEIIKAYMDESQEQEEEVIIENIEEPKKDEVKIEEPKKDEVKIEEIKDESPPIVPSIINKDEEPVVTKLTFNDMDAVQNIDGIVESIEAPKNIERLEEISNARALERKLEEEAEEENDKIKIHTDNLSLGDLDILDIEKSTNGGGDQLLLEDFEVLP
tara:strand:- start:2126 stop:3130 length:1005 start_codon:yes stop_codon:yes gene_type:complete